MQNAVGPWDAAVPLSKGDAAALCRGRSCLGADALVFGRSLVVVVAFVGVRYMASILRAEDESVR